MRKTPSLCLGLLGGWWNHDSDLPDLIIGGWRLPESVWKGLINVVLRRNGTAPVRTTGWCNSGICKRVGTPLITVGLSPMSL